MTAVADALPVVAAFDVDGTVTTRDCVVPFLRRVAGTAGLGRGLLPATPRLALAAVRRDRDTLKALAARAAFAGRPLTDIEQHGEAFAAVVERSWTRADTVARLRWHQGQGHATVLVSASFGVYLRPLARRLELGDVVATELVVDTDGRCTGALVEANCRGAEKVRRLHSWLDERHGGRPAIELWAYGDSPGDRQLLADADHATWVNE